MINTDCIHERGISLGHRYRIHRKRTLPGNALCIFEFSKDLLSFYFSTPQVGPFMNAQQNTFITCHHFSNSALAMEKKKKKRILLKASDSPLCFSDPNVAIRSVKDGYRVLFSLLHVLCS